MVGVKRTEAIKTMTERKKNNDGCQKKKLKPSKQRQKETKMMTGVKNRCHHNNERKKQKQ